MDTIEMFDQLLQVARESHALGCHEAAYHALMSAVHLAHDIGDVHRLHAVVREARAQIEWIDANAPTHRLSTASAALHAHAGVFRMLIRQGEMYAEMARRSARPAVR